MANYKRGKCRRNCPKAIRGSITSWRAVWGLRPVRLPPWSEWPSALTAEWNELWHPRGRHGNRGRKIRGPYTPMSSYPAWWDREFHTRPQRAETHRLERQVLNGRDPDDIAWPLRRKPHIYYW